MTFAVTLVERDDTVGHPDAQVVRQYCLATTDTLPHALRLAREYEPGPTGKRELIVNRNHPYEYGSIYRTTYVSVSFDEKGKP